MLSQGEGQVATLDYAPLPPSVAEKVKATVEKLQ
jgi:hypothetical protein